MNTNKSRVDKALSQDDLTVLANIKSAIDELMQMSAGAGSPPPPAKAEEPPSRGQDEFEPDKEVMMSDEAPEDVIDDKKAKKAIVTTPTDNPTTPDNEDAKKKLTDDAMPDESLDQLDEVARSLAKALLGISKGKVKKSEPSHPLVEALQKITSAISAQDQKIESVAKAMESFCEAFGINEQLEIARKSQVIPEANRRPIVNKDGDEVVKYLADILGQVKKGQESNQGTQIISSQAEQVRKNLRNPDMFSHLLPDNFKLKGEE